MKLDVYVCDKRGKKYDGDKGGSTLSASVGSQMDGAGARDDIMADADLCFPCQSRALAQFVYALPEPGRQLYMKTLQRRK